MNEFWSGNILARPAGEREYPGSHTKLPGEIWYRNLPATCLAVACGQEMVKNDQDLPDGQC
jgi:hypothetical protein